MNIKILKPNFTNSSNLPYYSNAVQAGFPSPADDYVESELDLNTYLIKKPAATFYVKAKGNSMIDLNIHEGDILIVDRSITPKTGMIVVALFNNEFTVKKIYIDKGNVKLLAGNSQYKPITITKDIEFEIWGVVSAVIHKFL